MHFRALKTFMCNGELVRRGGVLPESVTDTQLANYLKTGKAEQHEDKAKPAKKQQAKAKTTKPAAPAETK